MLLVMISLENCACSSTEIPQSSPRVRGSETYWKSPGTSPCRARIAPRPVAREQRRAEQAERGDRKNAGALAHASPEAVRDELAHGPAAARGVIHRDTTALHQPFEAGDQRVARGTAAARSRDPRRSRDTSFRGAELRPRPSRAGRLPARCTRCSNSVHVGARSATNSSTVLTWTSTRGSWSRRPKA